MKLLATGDIHIGAGGSQLADPLADTEAVLDQIVEIAAERQVDAILLAGDVFHRPRPTPPELHVFQRFARQLENAEIPAYAVIGDLGHDQSNVDQDTALALFTSSWLRVSKRPELIKAAGDIAIVTLPAVSTARLIADADTSDRSTLNEHAAEWLTSIADDLHSQAPAGWPTVLLGHWAVTGAALPNGLPADDFGKPMLDPRALTAIGFDAVVLGDIHRPQLIGDGPDPILYVGSPWTQNFGEADYEHGVWLLDFESGVAEAEFVPLGSRRFVTIDVDLTQDSPSGRAESQSAERGHARLHADGELGDQGPGMRARIPGPEDSRAEDSRNASGENAESSQDPIGLSPASPALDETDLIAAAIAERLPLTDAVIRMRYRCTEEQDRAVDKAALKKLCVDAGAHRVYQIQPEIIRQSRARADHVDETLEPLAAVDAWATVAGLDTDQTAALRDLAAELLGEQVTA